jgi:hypothetical protein
MTAHASVGFVGFSPEKAEVAEALHLHLKSTIRAYDNSPDNVRLIEAGQLQRSDSIHEVAQHSQVIWIEEKDAQTLSEVLLGSSSGLIQGT